MKPYYQADGITLYCGDMRKLTKRLADAVDVVVTDPPYEETSCEWDQWPAGWPNHLARLTNQLWCFGSLRMFLANVADFKLWNIAQDIVWEKHNGSSLHADRFRKVHELAVHFYRGKWGALYKLTPTITVTEDRRRTKLIRGKKPEHWGGVEMGKGYDYAGTRLMRSVITVASCHGYAVNETQKPEGIVAPLLKYSVPVGGLVLDPFAGSGTVLAVARQQGKRAIGIELQESQCAEIVKRLQQRELVTA